jgi:membrane associated rhomboid family serine protease
MSSFFTFGGRVPSTVGVLLALLGGASLWGALDPRVPALAALIPQAILAGEVWRIVTWPFVQRDVLGLLFGGFMLWSLGQQLSYAWSERRFLIRFINYTVVAGVGTTLLAVMLNDPTLGHVGIWPVVIALLVSWAMMFPDRQVNLWGVLPMTGKTLALLVVGGTILSGLFSGGIRGLATMAPHLIAITMAWLQARGLGRGGQRQWSLARRWWSEREQKRRSKHLKVVKKDKDGSDDRPRWMN